MSSFQNRWWNQEILTVDGKNLAPVEMANVTGFIAVLYTSKPWLVGMCESSTTTFKLSRRSPAILQETNHMSNLIALSVLSGEAPGSVVGIIGIPHPQNWFSRHPWLVMSQHPGWGGISSMYQALVLSCPSGVTGTLCEQHHLGYLWPIRCPIFFVDKKTNLDEGDWRSSCLEERCFCKFARFLVEIMNIEIIMKSWNGKWGKKRVHGAGNCLASNPWLKFNSKMPPEKLPESNRKPDPLPKAPFFWGVLLLNYRGVWLKTSTHYNCGPYKF